MDGTKELLLRETPSLLIESQAGQQSDTNSSLQPFIYDIIVSRGDSPTADI